MKAAVYQGKQRFQVKDLPDPKPGPGQVQIDIKYSAVCGTDVHGFMYDKVPPGSVIGHEFSGVVAQVGKGVTRWKAGDRVVGYGGTPPPGKGPFWSADPRYDFSATGFARGRTGAYAGKMVMEEWEPTPIPKNVPDLAAALCEPTAVGVHAVRKSKLRLGDSVAIVGAGPIGLLCMQAARVAGARKVIVSEPAPARAKAAAALGADEVINPLKEDAVGRMVALTEGVGPDVIFECAAGPNTLEQSLTAVRRKGQVVLIALAWEPTPVSPVAWAGREVEFLASFGAEPIDFRTTLDLMSTGEVNVDPLVSEAHILELGEIQSAFEELMKPRNKVQTVFKL